MKVALYARVSKSDETQNPENQFIRLRKYAQDQGYEVYEEYVDKASGADPNRPYLDKLLNDAKAHRFKFVQNFLARIYCQLEIKNVACGNYNCECLL